MILQPFNNYILQGKVVKQQPSIQLFKSLQRRAERRFNKIISEGIDKENPDFFFEQLYESLREAMQSLMAYKGFKPYSHEATIAFLASNYPITDMEIKQLDDMRKKRHDIVYYGADLEPIEAERALQFTKKLFPRIMGFAKRNNP